MPGPAFTRTPHFNHVAMSVPADLLDAEGRRDLVAFYGEVFGWQELPTETVDRRQLVLSAYRFDPFQLKAWPQSHDWLHAEGERYVTAVAEIVGGLALNSPDPD